MKNYSLVKMFEISALVLLAVLSIECNVASCCSTNQGTMSDLDIAIEMIMKAKQKNPGSNDYINGGLLRWATDCADVFEMGYNKSGVYTIRPKHRLIEEKLVDVYCDMETDGGGWTVIQRRGDFKRPYDYFYKDWKSYKEGFGDVEKDFWLGNDNIFALTNQKLCSARFDLRDVKQEKRYAVYDEFWIDDEDQKYTLHISDYFGDAGDSMIPVHNNRKFTAKDQDNDLHEVHCAVYDKGGWWYNRCHEANLNGLYVPGKLNDSMVYHTITWETWKGKHEALEWTEIKIRPKNFKKALKFMKTPM